MVNPFLPFSFRHLLVLAMGSHFTPRLARTVPFALYPYGRYCYFACGTAASANSYEQKKNPPAFRLRDFWSEWRDSNPRPLGPEPSTLPPALHPDPVVKEPFSPKSAFILYSKLCFLSTVGRVGSGEELAAKEGVLAGRIRPPPDGKKVPIPVWPRSRKGNLMTAARRPLQSAGDVVHSSCVLLFHLPHRRDIP